MLCLPVVSDMSFMGARQTSGADKHIARCQLPLLHSPACPCKLSSDQTKVREDLVVAGACDRIGLPLLEHCWMSCLA